MPTVGESTELDGLPGRPGARGGVALHRCAGGAPLRVHDLQTKTALARGFADWLGRPFIGETADGSGASDGRYLIPTDTVCGLAEADRLGLRGPDDLLGGVVAHAFVATKTITHPLPDEHAAAPEGWAPRCGPTLAPVTLPGFSAFSHGDAVRAGRRLLAHGPVRVKRAVGVGGRDQWVVDDAAALDRVLAALAPDAHRDGVVLEHQLEQVTTRSVGCLRLPGGHVFSYHGTQSITRDNRGGQVYGGSRLTMVRGGCADLLAVAATPPEVRIAVLQASIYHDTVMRCYPATFASRCNYDVAQGVDARGHWRSGVLEQSWRVGGATSAELAGLQAFRRDPSLRRVHARCEERYGAAGPPPRDALVLFDGDDPVEGPLCKFAVASGHVDP